MQEAKQAETVADIIAFYILIGLALQLHF